MWYSFRLDLQWISFYVVVEPNYPVDSIMLLKFVLGFVQRVFIYIRGPPRYINALAKAMNQYRLGCLLALGVR